MIYSSQAFIRRVLQVAPCWQGTRFAAFLMRRGRSQEEDEPVSRRHPESKHGRREPTAFRSTSSREEETSQAEWPWSSPNRDRLDNARASPWPRRPSVERPGKGTHQLGAAASPSVRPIDRKQPLQFAASRCVETALAGLS